MPINPCDLVGAALKDYVAGAKDLESFGRRIRSRYGESLAPDTMRVLFKKAEAKYLDDYRALDSIKTEMATAILKEVRAGRTFGQKAAGVLGETTKLMRALKTTVDQSTTFRQNLSNFGHFIKAGKLIGEQNRAMFGSRREGISGKDYAKRAEMEVANHPYRPLADEVGLALTPLETTDILRHEELSGSRYAEKIPGIRNVTGASDRAAVVHLNKARIDLFSDMVRKSDPGDGSLPLEDARKIAKYVNDVTGRGNLPEVLKGAQGVLQIFFGPKLYASRIDYLLGPGKLAAEMARTKFRGENLTKTQKVIAVEFARTYAGMLTVLGLAAAAGAKVSTDWRSTDFLKPKVGNNHYDLSGGLPQYVRLVGQLWTGETLNTEEKLTTLGKESFKPTTRADIFSRFFRSHLGPGYDVVGNVLKKSKSKDFRSEREPWWNKQIGTDFVGRPTTPASEIQNGFIPMITSGAFQSIAEGEGISRVMLNMLIDWFGGGASTYNIHDKKVPNADVTDILGITHEGSAAP